MMTFNPPETYGGCCFRVSRMRRVLCTPKRPTRGHLLQNHRDSPGAAPQQPPIETCREEERGHREQTKCEHALSPTPWATRVSPSLSVSPSLRNRSNQRRNPNRQEKCRYRDAVALHTHP